MSDEKKDFLTLGVDLGGTKVEAALVDVTGKILSSHRHPTHPEEGARKIIDDIVSCVGTCHERGDGEARALGIGIAAQVDSSGVIRSSPNLGWRDVPLRSMLEERLGLPVYVTNDVRAACWGEWLIGAGVGSDDLIVVFIGTGIGGGIVSSGRILEGCNNTAGEVGHTTLIVDGRDCHCPSRGCLEAYSGGWAIAERAQEAVQDDPEAGKSLVSLAGGIEKITAAVVSQAFHEGDPIASQLVRETTYYLGVGLVSLVNAFNPCLLVLGGGVVDGLPELIEGVEKIIKKRALKTAAEKLQIKRASLGDKAGIVGAAALARKMIE